MAEIKKRVYRFGGKHAEGDGKMRELLGGKGANLAEMNLLGMPVPAGFTITTECCTEYYRLGGGYTPELKAELPLRQLRRSWARNSVTQKIPSLSAAAPAPAAPCPA